jgi:hypothetical protein
MIDFVTLPAIFFSRFILQIGHDEARSAYRPKGMRACADVNVFRKMVMETRRSQGVPVTPSKNALLRLPSRRRCRAALPVPEGFAVGKAWSSAEVDCRFQNLVFQASAWNVTVVFLSINGWSGPSCST